MSTKGTPKTLTDAEVKRVLAATGRSEADLRDHVLLLVAVSTALDIADLKNGRGVKTVVTLRPSTTKGHREGEVVLACGGSS